MQRFPVPPRAVLDRFRRTRRRPVRARRRASAWLVLPLLAASLAGCVSMDDYNRVLSERDKWRTSVGVLEAENRQIRGIVKEWVKAYNALEARQKETAARPVTRSREARAEMEKLKERVQKYERQIDVLEARVETLKQDRDAFRNWYRIYRQRFTQAMLREQRLERRSKVYNRMVQNLEKEVEQGKLKLNEVRGRLTVSVLDRIVFSEGGTEINPAGKAVLDKLARLLRGITDKRIQVEGHTDNLPVRPTAASRFRDNWELSALRAASVVRYLHEVGGVDATLLSAVGYGPFQPVASNDTPEGRRKNRRIEIVLTPLPKRKISPSAASGDSASQGPQLPAPAKP
ncbi:MAG: OmpA family protein [Nitrospinota bacterium]